MQLWHVILILGGISLLLAFALAVLTKKEQREARAFMREGNHIMEQRFVRHQEKMERRLRDNLARMDANIRIILERIDRDRI